MGDAAVLSSSKGDLVAHVIERLAVLPSLS
jgi:hypothetical protein